MNRQSLLIIAIIASGSILSGLAYGVTNGSITVGDLTVTGTCTGCGASENSYTTWTKITDITTSRFASFATNNYIDAAVTNTGTFTINDLNTTVIFTKDGTEVAHYKSANDDFMLQPSMTLGKTVGMQYVTSYNFTGKFVNIYSNSTKVNTILVDTATKYDPNADIIAYISPNGKYILIWGYDQSGLNHDRLQLWQGS